MTLIEQYIDCMTRGDKIGLADLFNDNGTLHDSSLIKIGKDTLHLEGKMAVEMTFHSKFGFNGGPFPITSVKYLNDVSAYYFINYPQGLVPVYAFISEVDDNNKIKRINIYPL